MSLGERAVVEGVELLEGTPFGRGLLSSSDLLIKDTLSAFAGKDFYRAVEGSVNSAVEQGKPIVARLERGEEWSESEYVMHLSPPRTVAEFEAYGRPSRLEFSPFLNHPGVPDDWFVYVSDAQYPGRYLLPNMRVMTSPGLGRLSAISGSSVKAENEAGLAPTFFKELPIKGEPTTISFMNINWLREYSFEFTHPATLELRTSFALPSGQLFRAHSQLAAASAEARAVPSQFYPEERQLIETGRSLPWLRLRFTNLAIKGGTGAVNFWNPNGLLDNPVTSEVKTATHLPQCLRALDRHLFFGGKFQPGTNATATLIDALDASRSEATARVNPRSLKVESSGEQEWGM